MWTSRVVYYSFIVLLWPQLAVGGDAETSGGAEKRPRGILLRLV